MRKMPARIWLPCVFVLFFFSEINRKLMDDSERKSSSVFKCNKCEINYQVQGGIYRTIKIQFCVRICNEKL